MCKDQEVDQLKAALQEAIQTIAQLTQQVQGVGKGDGRGQIAFIVDLFGVTA